MKRLTKILRFSSLLLILVLLGQCEAEFPWKTKSKALQLLVIDGIITNELKAQSINVSQTNENMNMASVPVSGLIISVSDGSHDYSFTEAPDKAGSYLSIPFQAVVGKKYSLSIIANSKLYTSEATMAAITPMDTFILSGNAGTGLYEYTPVWDAEPGMLEVNFDWSSVPSYCSTAGHCLARETFYNLKNIDINKTFGPDQEKIYFPSGTKISRRKYSLTEEHQNFLRSLLMETEWRGGVFDVQPGNVKSNISNGGLGFFGACMVLKDSMIVK